MGCLEGADLWAVQDLAGAEDAYRVVCDQIARAERYHPQPGGSDGQQIDSTAADGATLLQRM
jgi:hypothetical protein